VLFALFLVVGEKARKHNVDDVCALWLIHKISILPESEQKKTFDKAF